MFISNLVDKALVRILFEHISYTVLPILQARKGNRAITNRKNKLKHNLSLMEVNEFVEVTASAISDTLGMKTQKYGDKKAKQPLWKRRIKKEIQKGKKNYHTP